MVARVFWIDKIEQAWKRRSIIWLCGVRRVGKTYLCKEISNTIYYDCERPSVRQQLDDPEFFLEQHLGKRLVLDEIHRLHNPSELLKIAADHYPDIKIIATGSSIIGASSKFKDTLAGRKVEIWLTPMLFEEAKSFGQENIEHRFLRGGLPPFFLSHDYQEKDFCEWIDAYWAKDIQELFRLGKRYSFQKLFELLLFQSGQIFEATKFTSLCEVSRPTITNYLSVLAATHVMHIVRPFSYHRSTEITSAPKVYGFDTGFVCYAKAHTVLRMEDYGLLLEHQVLNELQGKFQSKNIFYWRDKRHHEIDFIYMKNHGADPIAIECKWNGNKFEPINLNIFRKKYPRGDNFVVASNVQSPYRKKFGDLIVTFVNVADLVLEIEKI